MPNHFSATSSRKLKREHIIEVERDLKRLFRNRRNQKVEPEDFMFTCLSDYKRGWSGKDLPAKFIGQDTSVPYNERAVNGYRHKHNLAYLYNAFAHPSVPHTVNSFADLKYDGNVHALSVLLQWIWRSAIRTGQPIRVYMPSVRMRKLLLDWIEP